MSDRLRCEVIGCRRTRRREAGQEGPDWQWVCGKHWRLAPKAWRARRSRIKRRLKRELDPVRRARLERLDNQLWARCRARAIEVAMGISA